RIALRLSRSDWWSYFPPTPTVSVSPPTVSPGGTVTISFAQGPGLAHDWFAEYPVGYTNHDYITWDYLNGSQTPPTTGVTSATFSFTMPTTPGQYVFTFYTNDTYAPLSTSPTVTVQ